MIIDMYNFIFTVLADTWSALTNNYIASSVLLLLIVGFSLSLYGSIGGGR